MQKAFKAWTWSLGVVVRCPLSVLALLALDGLWGLAAYEWLWLPESSILILFASLLWALAQLLVGVSVLAGTAASTGAAAADGSPPKGGLAVMTFRPRLLARTALLVVAASPLLLAVTKFFSWVNAHDVEIASFLTLRSQSPISHIVIGKILWTIEALVWMVVGGFLVSFLIVLLHRDWREAWRGRKPTFADCCWRASFFSTLLSVAIFGGLSYLLATWHPEVLRGFWDYTQLVVRMGGALFFGVVGWLFWLLSLARLRLPQAERPPS